MILKSFFFEKVSLKLSETFGGFDKDEAWILFWIG